MKYKAQQGGSMVAFSGHWDLGPALQVATNQHRHGEENLRTNNEQDVLRTQKLILVNCKQIFIDNILY